MIEPQPNLTEAEVMAVRACIAGTANGDQQKIAMAWIMRDACMIADLSYTPGEQPLATAFKEGRRYSGILIRYMLEPLTLKKAIDADAKARSAPPVNPRRGKPK